jgi:predicted Zn-dependent protease
MIKTVGRKMVSALESYTASHGLDDAMSGLDWEFMLLKSDEVNAYCSPDGKIAFLEGILKYADTPDYVAVIMGHEMAHALAKHSRNRQTVATLVGLIGVVASEVVGAKKGDLAQTLFNLGFNVGSQLGVLLPYSRKQEYEADKIGVYIMKIAGYDIDAAPIFWERMMKGNESTQLDFLSTHPSDEKRIAALREVIEDLPNL